MLSRRSLLALGAAVFCVSALGPSAEARGHIHHGRTLGGFDLPDATNDGHIRGRLMSGGRVLLDLRTRTVETSATEGDIEGVLLRPNAPSGAPPFALVRGEYETDASGQQGRFRMVVLKPDPSGTNPPRRIGRIRGLFHDGQPNGTPGRYHGEWVLR